MTNKATKRALIFSVLALVLCMSMFVGTTYAWFTDSVTSGNNKIVAGTLKIDLELLDKDTEVWNSVKENSDPIFTYENWEPGYTDVKILKIQNEGTLALKWKATFVSAEELGILADVIDVYVKEGVTEYPTDRSEIDSWTKVGTVRDFVNNIETATVGTLAAKAEETLGIALKMQEAAGNEYQGERLGAFDITILATQLTSESDSFDDQYDKFADYDGEISNAVSLVAAMQNGGTYKVTKDIAVDDVVVISEGKEVLLDLNGNTLTGDIIAPNANLTITNGTINDTTAANSAIEINEGTLVLNNVDITSDRHPIRIDGDVTATINGGTYKVTGEEKMTTHALNVSGNANVTVNGGTFIGIKGTPNGNAMGGAAVNVQAGATVTINGGTFSGGVNDTLASNGTLIVKGGTFDQDPSEYVADSYGATENENGTWTVAYIPAVSVNGKEYDSFAEAMNTIQAGSTVTIELHKDATDSKFAIPTNANVTIDLNGNKLSYTKGSVTVTDNTGEPKTVWSAIGISAGATLTIKDGDITYTTGNTGLISNYGTLNLEGGTYSVSDSSSSAPMVLMNKTGGVVNATGVTFENACKAVAIDNEGEMTLTNCVIKQTNASAVDGAAIDNNNKLTLVNCTVSNAKANYQLLGQHRSTAVTTIESGSYTSTGKIGVDTGSYIINGGTFNVSPSASNVTINGTLNQNPDGTWIVTAE